MSGQRALADRPNIVLILNGGECDEPACFVDLLPTLTELADGTVPIDGIDIGGALRNGPMPEREALYFFQYWELNAVRTGRWKLHIDRHGHPSRDDRELAQPVDLRIDPAESYNVANREPEVLARLLDSATRFAAEIAAQRLQAQGRAAGRLA